MLKNLKLLPRATWTDATILISAGFTVLFFCVISFPEAVYLRTYNSAVLAVIAAFIIVLLIWGSLIVCSPGPDPLVTARLSLLPVFNLLLLIPYNYFYSMPNGVRPALALTITALGICLFSAVLSKPSRTAGVSKSSWSGIMIFAVVYAVVFGTVAVWRHFNFQDTSSFDMALFNQIQWNNIHGRFFQSSISGSNFVTHNSPFLILIAPLYAIHPHPATLQLIKSFVLASSVIPLALILKQYVRPRCVWPLLLSYMFYPFIVGQQFNAPHEMCFLPPFLLFTFYFFIRSRFSGFLVFLFLCLSVKEHMALIAVMFGLYALVLQRSRRWVFTSLIAGIAWGMFSLWIMHRFQLIYDVDLYPAWLIDNIKSRFLHPDQPLNLNIPWGIKTSVLGQFHSLNFLYVLFSPLILFLPLFSVISLLGLPELVINLAASIPLFYPTWHYNIVSATFLFLGSVEAIRQFSIRLPAKWPTDKVQSLGAWFLCLCVFCHAFLWLDFMHVKRDPVYIATMKEAIAQIPQNASVSAPKRLVSHVSTHDHYYLLEDDRKGEYILIDQNERIKSPVTTKGNLHYYENIFDRNGVRVYKKLLEIPGVTGN